MIICNCKYQAIAHQRNLRQMARMGKRGHAPSLRSLGRRLDHWYRRHNVIAEEFESKDLPRLGWFKFDVDQGEENIYFTLECGKRGFIKNWVTEDEEWPHQEMPEDPRVRQALGWADNI